LLYGYFALSAFWSQFPLASLKRLVQDFGCVLVALVILTERNPNEAMRTVFVRVAYVLFPLSVVFIRYFPHIGRTVSSVSGTHMLSGVTGHKNSLGLLTMVLGLVILWDLIEGRNSKSQPRTRSERWARPLALLIGLYLLVICQSATSVVCFVLGVSVLLARKRLAAMRNARRLILGAVVGIGFLLILEQAFGLSDVVFKALGRDSTLTGRTDIWRVTRAKNTHELIGAGFRGFWESQDGESVYRELRMNRLLTAHNGYLEVYLNGGLIAVVLLGLVIVRAGSIAIDKLLKGRPLGDIALLFWILGVLYNNSESDFFILTPLWFTWLLVTINWRIAPQQQSASSTSMKAPETLHIRNARVLQYGIS